MAKSPEYPRLDETNLAELEMRKNGWLGVTPHFGDGTELLTLTQLQVLHSTGTTQLPPQIEAVLQTNSAFSVLDRRLSRHATGRSTEFISKEKSPDVEAGNIIDRLLELQEQPDDRGYHFGITPMMVQGVYDGVSEMRERRTRSLLEEFKTEFESLKKMRVWMRTAQINGAATIHAARLVDFAIYGSGDDTVIEPVVLGLNNRRGLLPSDTLYVQPQLNIRL